ncbi:hypothetical protein EVA_16576 [gut metagenome]|uniref:Uncharacterized protein n=1 Tax=gut metagenome TaxID=749906 RepID=J9FLK7_9ZZZZ
MAHCHHGGQAKRTCGHLMHQQFMPCLETKPLLTTALPTVMRCVIDSERKTPMPIRQLIRICCI